MDEDNDIPALWITNFERMKVRIKELEAERERLRSMADPKRGMGLTAHSTKLDAAYVEGWNDAMAKIRAALEGK